ncbi:MAG: Crp/Fnr family transcriptional regulator [Eubacterium sp.]|nr:Crp/Fnr family transcriptional regulator [Eubacterium sp.]MDD7210178.1 Crp/Fnr family transcriptional regulator [Lachnospiraceae bacterium]MDY5498284.1 Crp/Fnr family transcriptional regulator [Anaerobutyricum sp.]
MNWELIQENSVFKDMSKEELKKLLICSQAVYKSYQKGEMVFREEEKAGFLYVLIKGRVIIAKQMASGRKNILYEVNQGHIFGEYYVFGEEHIYQYNAQAASDVEVLGIPWKFFFGYCSKNCEHHRKLIRNMLEVLSTKEWMAIKKVNIVSASFLKERIALWIMDEMDSEGVVRMHMNREELADYLGVARPSLSRTLMKMQAEGIIEVGRKVIRIKDRKKVEELCN